MIKFIKAAVKKTPPIRRLIEERDQLKAHLARINQELAEMSEHLGRIAAERDEFSSHLERINKESSESSLALARVLRERDDLNQSLRQVIRDRYHLDPVKNPNLRYFLPGDFYSPIPDLDEVKKYEQRIFHDPKIIREVDLNLTGQLELVSLLRVFWREFPFGMAKTEGLRYYLGNPIFSGGDACLLYAMIRHLRPKRVIEVGSGFSSCLMLDTNELFLQGEIAFTFIDPHPESLRSLLTEKDDQNVKIISQRVQDVSLETFSSLESGDVLFVDSSHVSKVGSDVNYLFFEVLPVLRAGVYVHFHDIFFPFEYPTEWVYEGRAWNEAYLLRAFLQYNRAFRIILFNALIARLCPQELQQAMPLSMDRTGGIWIRKLEIAPQNIPN